MSDGQVTQQTEDPPREEIALRAYHLWEQRGRPIGSSEQDWSRAEDEIRGEKAADEEWVRIRNEEVRSHHKLEEGSAPPFTDFSGAL